MNVESSPAVFRLPVKIWLVKKFVAIMVFCSKY